MSYPKYALRVYGPHGQLETIRTLDIPEKAIFNIFKIRAIAQRIFDQEYPTASSAMLIRDNVSSMPRIYHK